MNGRDDTTTFVPLDLRIGGQSWHFCPTVGQCLTRDQTRYIYKKVETWENDKHGHDMARDRTGNAIK